MASEVTIPRLGWNMEEGIFVGWLKGDGDRVAAGEPLFSLEGDKSTQDVESIESGILRIPPGGPSDGEKIAVGTLIGYLVAPGEPAPFEASASHPQPPAGVVSGGDGQALAKAPPAPLRIEPRPAGRKPRISPRARRVARELGIDALACQGTGHGGRILERDIRAAAVAPTASTNGSQEVAMTAIRRTIAERMVQSAQTTAGVTLSTTVDATNLVNLRRQFKAVAAPGETPIISFTDIMIKLTAIALEKHPLLNSRWNGDKIEVVSKINIGIAVDTDLGLFVPVIRDVPGQTLRQVASQTRELIDRARRGSLTSADMRGGTFTVTNLGPMGIEMFTPLINIPECAILGLGRIQKQVVDVDNQFVSRERMVLSLTFDHRIIDGAPAARFLQTLGQVLENPSPWLLP
jgi:pyruvate dehydrogenase E2 component (dihydrolipoamide acetyltransferase)